MEGILFRVIIWPGSRETGPFFSNKLKQPNHKHRIEKETSWDSLKPNFKQYEQAEDFREIHAAGSSSSMWQPGMGGSLAALGFSTMGRWGSEIRQSVLLHMQNWINHHL